MRRVVITGLGVVSPLGNDLNSFWNALIQGKTGVSRLSKLPADDYKGDTLSAEVKWESARYPTMKGESQAINYAIKAAQDCLADARLNHVLERNRYAVIIGTTSGNQDLIERTIDEDDICSTEDKFSAQAINTLSKVRPIRLSALLAKTIKFQGANMVIPTACAAGNYALGTAFSMIQSGQTPIALAGGADGFTRSCYTIFYRLGGMTYRDCRPFDQERSGMVVGEGAGMLLLEDLEHALARGAKIYAEIKGYGLACDAHHRVAPDPEGKGAALAMQQAIQYAGIEKYSVDLISAHGTGTPANDSQEAKALMSVFGQTLGSIPISGLKSMLGHCMGAASALEAIAAVMSIQEKIIPPTINTQAVDSAYRGILDVIPTEARSKEVKTVLSNAFGFGGNICSVLFSQFEPTKIASHA
jgi:3-oxoacyl-[acyl-carrier-protein] synthase II